MSTTSFGTGTPRAAGGSIHGHFAARAAAAPDAPAVTLGGRTLTYAELERRANRLAHHLRRLGVGRETRVGVCMERSPELVAALLAVLKAGGAYVPLDPAYPRERLAFMRDDARVAVLLADDASADAMSADGVPTVRLDASWAAFAGEPETAPEGEAGPDQLAYVVYTSGTTGRPKGAAATHRAVLRLVVDPGYADLSPDDVVLHFAPASFDAATFEVWGALLNGARLAVVPPGAPALDELGAVIREEGVTTLWLTAGLFHAMVDERLGDLRGVRQLLAGGDVLSPAHARKLLREIPGIRLVNGYGPTETTTFACCHAVTDPASVDGPVPIGRPIRETYVRVLDEAMRPVPGGEPGELYIGGSGLARGYLDRPGQTAGAFVPDPLGEPGARLYRTGDQARLLADGAVDFLGRIDGQVKVRGFRIELGEVESVLAGHPGVRQAAVVARDDEGRKRLVAYVVPATGTQAPPAAALRAFLRERLPDYMVPSAFVALAALPLTPNGKVDRRALPDPDARPSSVSPVEPNDGTTLHGAFAARAAEAPDAAAVVFGERTLSYAELDRAADRLARRLLRMGLRPEEPVGVCMERAPELVVSFLGAMKAGGAYLPLDPAYPADRLAYMVGDSGTRFVLVTDAASSPLAGGPATLVEVGEDSEEEDGTIALPEVCAESVAYVIYTSGSTGRPKGVAVPHRGIVATGRAGIANMEVRPGDTFLQFASASFDASVYEMTMALLGGAALRMAPREALLPGPGLVRLMESAGVTQAILPPSALAVLPAAALPSLRALKSAGEACPRDVVRRWAPGRRFLNGYGPTEASVCATAAFCEPDGAAPPIGAALPGVTARVVDDSLRAVGGGEAGELVLGGVGVARGYLGRPALTAGRFVPDPFSSAPGARMYRTGDRARVRDDGALEFLGRIDDQVKVRGYRIEPGEVAAALEAHDTVARAVVTVREDAPGMRRLVAYVVANGGREIDAGLLRDHLRRSLPEWMVPAAFVRLDAFPLTPNGKVDRAALPAPDAPESSAGYVAPRSETERAVAEVWEEVLGIGRVGMDDPFFALGGHSLAATGVVSRVRDLLGVEAPMSALFGPATAASFAAAVDAARAATAAPALPPVVPVPRDGRDFPLSASQERVWFLLQLAPENLAYHAHASLTFRGRLDVPALEAAMTEVVRRHEIFRSSLPSVDGRPVQRVHPPMEIRFPVTQLAGIAEEDREAAVRAWMDAGFQRRFDLDEAPLVRWDLLKLADDHHVLVQVEHHVVHDGWSFNILLAELMEVYRARLEGREPVLPELPLQFVDYCVWQREWMRSDHAKAQVEFWRGKLAGSQPVLELPYDRPRPAVQRFRGGAPRFRLPGALVRRVQALSRAEGATPFMTMLSAFNVLLSRYAGQDDVNVATAIAVRGQPEVSRVIGMFVNSMVLRTDLSGDPSFRALLGRVRDAALEGYAHQDVPFDAVVDAVRPDRSLSRNPLFQVMFSFHDSAQPALDFPGAEVEVEVALSNHTAKFDMNLVGIPHTGGAADPDGMTLLWEYDSDLFDASTIHRMFGHFAALLERAVESPDAAISSLRMLDAAEWRHVLHQANETARDYPRDATIHALVSAAAARTPDAVAVEFGDRRWTYRELEARAERIARRLRALGAGPDARVALCVERSPEMVAAMLGALRAGAAYVPLDPAYPAERIAYVLEDSRAAVLVTQERLRGVLPETAVPALLLDSEGSDSEDASVDIGPDATAASLAYVIYTSGSTGRPKGVMVPHGGVANFLLSMREAPGLAPGDRLLAVTTISFDIAVLEIFLPLVTGATVVLADRETAADGARLRERLEAGGISAMQATPATWRMLLEAGWTPPPDLKLLCGGEALPRELAGALVAGGTRLSNLYGPTETTVWSTMDTVVAEGPVTIGRPIANTRVYVVDGALGLCPVGVPGELTVAGDGVTRGYWARPALTAERFVPDPYSPTSGARMYRTGDRARWRADGRLEYMGRLDAQVKVRGHRIEPGEVEAALLRHPAVRQAVVAARGPAGAARLVAYLVPGGEPVAPGDLRAALRDALPEYMVPSAFVWMEAFPLTPNGKLDRRALPEPDGARPEGAAFVPPRTPAEETLAALWREVLSIDRVGVHDDFFDLGGDSIRTVQVAARATRAGLPLTPRQVFQNPTVAALAIVAAEAETAVESKPAESPPIAIVPGDPEIEAAYPLTALQEGMLYHTLSAPGSGVYVQQFVLTFRGELREDLLELAWNVVTARHPALRTAFQWGDGGAPRQRVHRHASVPFEAHDWRALDEEARETRREALLAAGRARGFDVARAPLMHVALLRLADDADECVWTHHHLLLDGWSAQLVLRDLLASYAALLRRRLPALAPAPAYGAYLAWLARQDLGAAEGFWRDALSGAGATPLPPSVSGEGDGQGQTVLEMDGAALDRLRALARAHRVTLSTVVQGAWALLLARWTGRSDVVHGTVVSGRPADLAGVEETVGLFVNTLPVRVAAPATAPLGTYLAAAQERHLALRQFEHAPLPSVHAWSGARERTLFETLFAFENYPVQAASAAGEAGLELAAAHAVEQTNYPLTVVARAAQGLRLKAMFDRARIGKDDAVRVLGAFAALLEAMAAAPEATLGALPRLEIEAVSTRIVETATEAPVEAGTVVAAAPAAVHVASRTATEERIAALWRELLRVDEVGVEENFFDAGGDSLLGMRLISRIRAGFGVDLQMRALAEAPTVAGMAARVEALLAPAPAGGDGTVDDLLDQLGMLSDDELEQLLFASGQEDAEA